MMTSSRFLPAVAAGVLALALAACSSGPKVGAGIPPAMETSPAEVDAIAELLDRGKVKDARKRLNAALEGDPMNPSLLVLRQGMVGDARADLGPANYPYTAAPGDTMAALAQRFLGNRLKSYQLARYNDLDNPAGLEPGQVLRIPGQPAGAASDRRAETPAPSRSNKNAVDAPAAKPRLAPTPAPAVVARRVDAAGAQRARTTGLAALNRGDVAEAVTLLQRAAALDPRNEAITRDLARARRIAATVRSQR